MIRTKKDIVHKIKFNEGNTTWCNDGFSMDEKGKWTKTFTLDEDKVTCPSCLFQLKEMRRRWNHRAEIYQHNIINK